MERPQDSRHSIRIIRIVNLHRLFLLNLGRNAVQTIAFFLGYKEDLFPKVSVMVLISGEILDLISITLKNNINKLFSLLIF